MNTTYLSARRGPHRGVCLLALGVTTLVLLATLGVTANANDITAGSVLQTATKAIAQQTGAHVVFVAHSSSSSTTEKIIADVGTTSGSEALSEGKATLAIRVTPADAYVRGSQSGLTTLFGMTAAQAKKLGMKWESWKSGTKQYSNLKGDLTMSSVSTLLPEPKGTKLSTRVTDGSTLYVLKWTVAATKSVPTLSDTLTISAMGSGLPIEETETAASGVNVKTELSKWGENVTVLAPPAVSTVASSKVAG
jgi:hypothetical protein